MNTYQLLPVLAEDDYQRLRADIAARGVLVPIEVDENGAVLDGHNRQRIAADLGVDCPRVVRKGMAEHEKRLYAVALNQARRQLTDTQKTILGKRIAPDVEERARLRQLATLKQGAELPVQDKCPERGQSRDEIADLVGLGSGRTFERNAKSLDRIAESDPDLYEQAEVGLLDLRRAARISRDRQAESSRVEQAKVDAESAGAPTKVSIRHGDFREVLADLRDVDAVITDPPYPFEFLDLLDDLAAWADKVLTPDGVLAVLIGQTHLPEVYRRLAGHRPYRWTGCYLTEGPGYVSHPRRVQSSWKPLLVYGGGPRFGDVIRSTGDDKRHHKWGQNYDAFHAIIERLTSQGQTVVDPFMGAGTTLLAAHALGRHAVGADIDAEAVASAQVRFS